MGIDPLTHKPLSTQAQESKKSLVYHDDKNQIQSEQDLTNTSISGDGFCIDEVPLLNPNEIVMEISSPANQHNVNNIHITNFTSPSSSSSSISSCTTSVKPGDEFSKFLDEMKTLDLKWLSSEDSSGDTLCKEDKFNNDVDTMNLWDINDLSSLDLFMNDHNDNFVGTGHGCSRTVVDEDSWTFDLL